MEKLNNAERSIRNLDLAKYFKKGSPTHQRLKGIEKETSEKKTDVELQRTLKAESLNNLREIMDKMNERELGR